MAFIYQINFPEKFIPLRNYTHKTGFNEVFENDKNRILEYLNQTFFINDQSYAHFIKTDEISFFLTGVWGDQNGNKIIDVFGYNFNGNWPGNPDISNWTVKNGVWIKGNRISECGDMAIVKGEEEKYRRTKKNLKDYINNPVPIKILEENGVFEKRSTFT